MDHARPLADLVAIDSVNPALVPGAAGEAEIAAYVAALMLNAHVDTVGVAGMRIGLRRA